MQTAQELNANFGVEGCLTFDEPHLGMPRARITTLTCEAELYLQGAHLTQWQPKGQRPALFLSDLSQYVPGKAIRGGIPIIFPWFGAPETSPVHPAPGSSSHGFARIWPWTIRFAALAGEDVHLSLTLDHNERLHATGFDSLQLGVDFIFGKTLTVRVTAANAASGPDAKSFLIEEALHAYLNIGDIGQIGLTGLADTDFLDKPDDFRRKHQVESALHFTGETDRPYLNTVHPITVHDDVFERRLVITKSNSNTTVVWNPAAQLAAKLPDLSPDDWRHFVCVETANAADNAITLRPGEAHSMTMQLAVEALQ